MLRPDVVVLGDGAIVPESNLIQPAPARFTHELTRDEPYRFDNAGFSGQPHGVLSAGTLVVVAAKGPETSRVVAGSGLCVDVSTAALRRLPED